MEIVPSEFDLASLTTTTLGKLTQSQSPVVILLPVGSIEPHGPHLSLITDTVISQSAAIRAAVMLRSAGVAPFIAPPISYGVTECAKAFVGAISVSAETLQAFLQEIVSSFLNSNISHVCLINNHLEPGHYKAICQAIENLAAGKASVACPLTKRWAKTLSEEFKRGECHAGQYETSIVLAADPQLVNKEEQAKLPNVSISLSDKLRDGISDFVEMGLTQSYSGSPSLASAKEGNELLDRLAMMIAVEVLEALGIDHHGNS